MSLNFRNALDWLGFGTSPAQPGHDHGEPTRHGHTHGAIDPSLTTSDRGIWALKWSFIILAVTAALQLAVVFVSGSVALLADTIHNVGDATTAIPLWVAFVLARRKPSKTFTYGLGRVEDLAGILIVLIILASALVAGYEAIDRLIHPRPVTQLGWLAAAGVVGFIGNEVVAVFRIRVGRQMNSAALIADGYHARTDGLTSLAVVLGAIGVALGYPIADAIIGLLITLTIFGIVWQSAKAVITRTLDGVEPNVIDEMRHAIEHVPGISRIVELKARWSGHRLQADIRIAVAEASTLASATGTARKLEAALRTHIAALETVNVMLETSAEGPALARLPAPHAHAPEPFTFDHDIAKGNLQIVDTPDGERMRLKFDRLDIRLTASVEIDRPGGKAEHLELNALPEDASTLQSATAPSEPHEFSATLHLTSPQGTAALPFVMEEPEGHPH
jgi:cation diffusion facilitator family transporter